MAQPVTKAAFREKKCGRQWCQALGTERWSRKTSFCARCFRIVRMLYMAHKRYPDRSLSFDEVSALLAAVEPDLKCPACTKQMHMVSGGPRGSLVTIQHYNDGRLGMLCGTCNISHGHSKLGDAFWSVPAGHKFCPTCESIKPFADYRKNASTRTGLANECRACATEVNRKQYQQRKHHKEAACLNP